MSREKLVEEGVIADASAVEREAALWAAGYKLAQVHKHPYCNSSVLFPSACTSLLLTQRSSIPLAQLKQACKERKLAVSGNKVREQSSAVDALWTPRCHSYSPYHGTVL